ncbi:hypothetical protein O3M35_003521 [Rhynocoris fuscipes]|uniref:Annexin n=1 Tax=Rhynocoris fuscipes TaxID=488301 RepID=A0AAW1CKY5_9HEMI
MNRNNQLTSSFNRRFTIQQKFLTANEKTVINLFDSELQAKRLNKALNGFIADVNTISEILGTINEYEIIRLLQDYKRIYGKKLSSILNDKLAGDYEELCQIIILEQKDFIVKKLDELLQEYPHPKEDYLIALLIERTNDEIKIIKDTYLKKFGRTLEEAFDSFLDPIGSSYIKILLNSNREDDLNLTSLQAHLDAQTLINLGIGTQYNGSGPIMVTLLKKRGYQHMRLVFSEYYRISGGYNVWDCIEKNMRKEHKKMLKIIMEAINNPEIFIANILLKSYGNSKLFCDTLVTVRFSRNKEFYKTVEHMYTDIRNNKMREDIQIHSKDSVASLLCKIIDI